MTTSFILLLKALGELLGACIILYLLVYIFGPYSIVFRVLPTGRRQKIGYLWRIKGEYILYDTLLPLFESSKIGFIKGYEVRPLVVNAQQNMVQKLLGTFTDDGHVNNRQGIPVARCQDPNARSTDILAANGEVVGHISGALRAKGDLTVRAAGFAVLCEEEDPDRSVFDIRVGIRDLILPAAVAYMLLYYPLHLLTKNFVDGASHLYLLLMLLYFAVFTGILFVIKYEKTMHNQSIDYLIGLIDRNVGVKWLNILIIITAGVALRTASIETMPLFTVIMGAFLINLSCFTTKWHIEQPGTNWARRIPVAPPQAVPSANASRHTVRKFSWGPVMSLKGINNCKDEVELTFEETDFCDATAPVRAANPFRSGPVTSDEDLSARAKKVLAGAPTANGSEETALAKILNSAYQLCLQYGLADFEMFDLVLSFVQTNVSYVIDEESEAIDKIREYFRFACETLYDREGDCDCKSVLAYRLFEKLGVDVDLVTVKTGNQGYYNHVAIVLKNNPAANIQLPPEYTEYAPGMGVYCESTGYGFKPGEVPKDVDTSSIFAIS